MSTVVCRVCGRGHDERFCPFCHKKYMDGEMPFSKIPDELMPFYDYGIQKINWPYEMWEDCEIIRRDMIKELQGQAGQIGSAAGQKMFRARANKKARDRVQEVIRKFLPTLQGMQALYDSTDEDLTDCKIQF